MASSSDNLFPSQYTSIADLPFTLSLDIKSIGGTAAPRHAKHRATAEFTWDDSFERKIVEKYEKRLLKKTLTTIATAKESSTLKNSSSALKSPPSLGRNTSKVLENDDSRLRKINEALQSVNLNSKKEIPPLEKEAPADKPPSKIHESPIDDMEDRTIGKTPEEIAVMYLSDETVERQSMYAEIFRLTRVLSPAPTSMEVLRAYFAYEGDVDRAVTALGAFVALKELGFPLDNIWLALLMHNNNQEEALEYLIRGGASGE